MNITSSSVSTRRNSRAVKTSASPTTAPLRALGTCGLTRPAGSDCSPHCCSRRRCCPPPLAASRRLAPSASPDDLMEVILQHGSSRRSAGHQASRKARWLRTGFCDAAACRCHDRCATWRPPAAPTDLAGPPGGLLVGGACSPPVVTGQWSAAAASVPQRRAGECRIGWAAGALRRRLGERDDVWLADRPAWRQLPGQQVAAHVGGDARGPGSPPW
jgi:hypothetical protein